MKTKPQAVVLKLAGNWFSLPFVSDDTKEYIGFGNRQSAKKFSRDQAAKILRRIRSWGGKYYRMEVLP